MKMAVMGLVALMMGAAGCNDSKPDPFDTATGDTDPPDACEPVLDTDGSVASEVIGDANSVDENCDGMAVLGRHNENGAYSAYHVTLIPWDEGYGCWADIFDGYGHIWCVQMMPLGGGLTPAADAEILIEGTEESGYTSLQVGWTNEGGGVVTIGNDYAGPIDEGCVYFVPRPEFEAGGNWSLPGDATGSVCGTQTEAYVGSGHGVADLTGDGVEDFFTSSPGILNIFEGPFDFTAHQELTAATFTLNLCPDEDCSGYVGKQFGVGESLFYYTDYKYDAGMGQEGKVWTIPLPLTPTSIPTAIATAGMDGAPGNFGHDVATLSEDRYVMGTTDGLALFDPTGFVQTIGDPPTAYELVYTLGVDAFIANGVEYIAVGDGSLESPRLKVYAIHADNTWELVLTPYLPGGEDTFCGSRIDIDNCRNGLCGVYGCQDGRNSSLFTPQAYGGGTFVLSLP